MAVSEFDRYIHRINDYMLFRMYSDNLTSPVLYINGKNNTVQYIMSKSPDGLNQSNILERTVWYENIDDSNLKFRVNKIYSNPSIYIPLLVGDMPTINIQQVGLMLQQGFRWTGVFGILVVVRGVTTNNVYMSQILYENDFHITGNRELINGAFWLEEALFYIPTTKNILNPVTNKTINELLEVETIVVNYSDIEVNNQNSIGYISNYPVELIPLIEVKLIPDFIKNQVFFDDNNFLNIRVFTTESVSLEQSILNYFNLESAIIVVNHVITYGIDGIGFYSLKISNENDKYQPIKIALDLSSFTNNPIANILINVSSEIYVDNKLMSRQNSINIKVSDYLDPKLADLITHPTTNYPVEVKLTNTVNQTIIQAQETERVIPIYQNIFAQFIITDIVYEKKSIYFDKISFPCYLIIATKEEQRILNQKLVDDTYIFSLENIVPPEADTTYKLERADNRVVIGEGKFILPEKK
jgi:hypothetical protein